jgi:hypothetical protein
MSIIIGSARHDEKGGYSGGAKGDSLQGSAPDYRGEVSMQKFYVHKKGWNVIRAKDPTIGAKIAEKMKAACNNRNIGYSQSDRYAVLRDGISTTKPSNCDCSSLVRACVKEATGKDPGDFTTSNAEPKLTATGLFYPPFVYTPQTVLRKGDILCTRSKGHIVAVTDTDAPTAVSGSSAPVNGNQSREPTKNVKRGTKGNDAKWLQVELNNRGYRLIVDGEIGQKSEAALIDFQKKNSLTPDGICGPATRAALKKNSS